MAIHPLVMISEGDGRYYITSKDRKKQMLRFPDVAAIRIIWHRHHPRMSIQVLERPNLSQPRRGISIQVTGSGMNATTKNAFCRDLLQICRVTAEAP
jgi:hypothetical protein